MDGVDKEKIKDDPRYQFGIPTVDNANYLWIQDFYGALNEQGRAGFVMANSASDARGSELEIRKKIIETGAVDVIISIGPNFFYTVTLPCTLWFFDRAKAGTDRRDKVLFIDAREIFTQVTRALREFTPAQIEFIANIVRLYRGQPTQNREDSEELMKESFPDGKYVDVPGLCKVATIQEIEEQGWSLNPGRYVGIANGSEEDFHFTGRFRELSDDLESLCNEARQLEEKVRQNRAWILGGASPWARGE
ncbi:MAG: N-6 DNA Methylase [Bacteroidetes bacterium ADurb.BinA104]|nr:MAG: N-6 DNA Methylase [Bacteroidetes bacterium ADurb.BinA104]